MAAFETVSRLKITTVSQETATEIDIRYARLPTEPPPIGDFDPHAHRQPQKPIKLWMAYFNLIRTVFGAGMLGLPLAISQAGLILGFFMTLASGLLLTYMHITLIFVYEILGSDEGGAVLANEYEFRILRLWCLHEISRQLKIPYVSYRYGFRIALLHGPQIFRTIGNHGVFIITSFMFLSQVGICTVFIIFTSDSLRDIMDWDTSRPALYWLFVPYTLLVFFIRNFKSLAYVSMFGNVLNFIGLALVLYFMVGTPRSEFHLASTQPLQIIFAFGTMLFNISALAVILAIDKASPDPVSLIKRFGVIEIGIMVPTVLSAIFGSLGCWAFGVMEENILRSLPFSESLAMIAIGLYMCAVAMAYPIQSFPGIQLVLDVYKSYASEEPTPTDMRIAEAIIRPCFVLITFLVSGFIPFQGPFVAFVGNMCTTLLALVFPAMMELSIIYPGPYGRYKIHLVKNIAIIVLGLIATTIGVTQCGYLLYVRFVMSSDFEDL